MLSAPDAHFWFGVIQVSQTAPKQKWSSPQGGSCCSLDHFHAGDNLLDIDIRVDEPTGCAAAQAGRWCEVDPRWAKVKQKKDENEQCSNKVWPSSQIMFYILFPGTMTGLRLSLGLCWDIHTCSSFYGLIFPPHWYNNLFLSVSISCRCLNISFKRLGVKRLLWTVFLFVKLIASLIICIIVTVTFLSVWHQNYQKMSMNDPPV